jgi:hypothetical protein
MGRPSLPLGDRDISCSFAIAWSPYLMSLRDAGGSSTVTLSLPCSPDGAPSNVDGRVPFTHRLDAGARRSQTSWASQVTVRQQLATHLPIPIDQYRAPCPPPNGHGLCDVLQPRSPPHQPGPPDPVGRLAHGPPPTPLRPCLRPSKKPPPVVRKTGSTSHSTGCRRSTISDFMGEPGNCAPATRRA